MSTPRELYFDHNATTGLLPEGLAFCQQTLACWGNPSSIHGSGRGPKVILRDARLAVAQLLNVSPLEIIFTGSGSESNNTVLKGAWLVPGRVRDRILIGATEHPAILRAAEAMAKFYGARVDRIPVDRSGRVDLERYQTLLGPDVFLVSQMMANNETGSIYPVGKMCKLAHAAGALFHTDGVQALGKIPVDLQALNVDYASFAGHKFYALKGSGLLFVKKGAPLEPLIHGGGQERGRRAGTENVLAIGSLGLQAARGLEIISQGIRLATLRDELEDRLKRELGGIEVNGDAVPRLPNTSNFVIDGVDGEILLMNLDMEGVRVSTGAACSSGAQEPSPILRAMGLTPNQAQSSLRVSMGWQTTAEDVTRLGNILIKIVRRLRGLESAMENENSGGTCGT